MNLWSRLGLSVAVAAIYCIIMTEALRSTYTYENYRWYFCVALMVSGAALTLIGLQMSVQCKAEDEPGGARDGLVLEGPQGDSEEVNRPWWVGQLAFWGPLFVVFGVLMVFIIPMPKDQAMASPVKPAPTNATPAVAAKPPPPPSVPKPAVFPNLKLQGLIYHPRKPSVVINGRTFFVGDYIEEARVVDIDMRSVTLELQGQRKVFPLLR